MIILDKPSNPLRVIELYITTKMTSIAYDTKLQICHL